MHCGLVLYPNLFVTHDASEERQVHRKERASDERRYGGGGVPVVAACVHP